MRRWPAPTARAASTYGFAITDSAAPRMTRDALAAPRMERARIRLGSPGPSAAIRDRTTTSAGNDIHASTTRWTTMSYAPPRYALETPMAVAINVASATVANRKRVDGIRHRRLVTDSRIQYGVHEIDRQIRQDDDDNDDQVDPLDHRIVALHDRVDEELSHARDAEDPLDDHRAAGDARHLEAEHRHHGDHRVLQGVLEHHGTLAEALGPGRPHVVLPQHLQQHAARQPHDPGRRGDT